VNPDVQTFLTLDLMPLAAAILAAVSCGLIGNFLVLRRMAMMGDAISHAVLPGLIIAFLITGENTTFPMLFGAALAGVACALFVEVIQKAVKLDPGASMGVVFTILFALGVVLVSAKARHTHVDADCVLYGALEHLSLAWEPPESLSALLAPSTFTTLPRQIISLLVTLAITVFSIALLFKELRISCFDPTLASALGFNASLLHLLLMLLVALSVVASFEAVGVILVVAMLVAPAAIARLFTDRLHTQLALSGVIAATIGAGGYFAATRGPAFLFGSGAPELEVSGMMATLAGAGVLLASIIAPRHGMLARIMRRYLHTLRVLAEDQLAMLYRIEETESQTPRAVTRLHVLRAVSTSMSSRILSRQALRKNIKHRLIARSRGTQTELELTPAGRAAAQSVVRSHRLWESYLVRELGMRADHVHRPAMDLEHVTSPDMTRDLERVHPAAAPDPHGRPIPNSEKNHT